MLLRTVAFISNDGSLAAVIKTSDNMKNKYSATTI